MQQHTFRSLLSLSLLALGPGLGCATAAEEAPAWSLSGFGTFGVVHASERHADYTSSVLKANGAGATRAWSTDVDSRLGVQLDASLNRTWSAVLQMISEQGLDGSYRPRVEWANVKYQPTPELALRAGRIALPVYLTADYRKVGYSYPWVRPPVETYAAVPFTSSDGVDATWRWSAGQVSNASQVFYGHANLTLTAPRRGWARGIVGISNTSDWGALSVRASLISAQLTTDIGAELFQAFDAFGPAGHAIRQHYDIDHKRATIADIGVSYDPGAWFVMAEAGDGHSTSLLGATRSAYLSAGWRQGAFTPYMTLARVRATSPTSDPGLPLAALPASYRAQGAMLNAGINAYLATIPQQTSASAGLRWDLRRNAALKLQYDRVTPHDGSRGTFINTAPGFESGHAADVFSLALDIVY